MGSPLAANPGAGKRGAPGRWKTWFESWLGHYVSCGCVAFSRSLFFRDSSYEPAQHPWWMLDGKDGGDEPRRWGNAL